MKILAISSGGGHWVQLMRIRKAFDGHRVVYATVNRSSLLEIGEQGGYVIPDATRWNKLLLIVLFFRLARIVIKERPDVIVSTGAAPGYIAIRVGKYCGARTVWVDSIANVERLSMSGERVGPWCDLWLTQWPHLAKAEGPEYRGQVL